MKQLKVATDVKIKKLMLSTKRLVTSKFLGSYKSVFKGKGLEFEGYRFYAPDDDASMIDWKASLRTDQILVKEFVEERNLTVFFLIDCGSSMILSSTEKLKSEYAAELVTTLAFTTLSSGDNVGFIMFAGKPVFQSPPRSGLKEYHRLLEALTNPRLYSGEFDFSEASKFSLSYVPANSMLLIVSDFIAGEKVLRKNLAILAQKFDVIGVMVRDPLDIVIPKGMGYVLVKDPFSEKTLLIEPNVIADKYREEARRGASAVKREFLENGCDFLELATNKPFAKPLLEFFEWRANKRR